MSYRVKLKTGLVLALQKVFTADYPAKKLRRIHVSIEYPVESQNYPGIWVDFDESTLENIGIDHRETDDDGNRVLRWRFEGQVSYTIASLTSLERDAIYDELIKVLAFGRSSEVLSPFREFVETNEFIAMNFNFDEIQVSGNAATPGTPWETDEIIYESTVSVEVVGEFTTDVNTGDLARLSRIVIDGRTMPSTEEDPQDPQHWQVPAQGLGTGEWH